MNDQHDQTDPPRPHFLKKFDNFVKKFIPNFNTRAVVYFSLIFAIALYLQIWRIASPTPPTNTNQGKQETVIADDTYWASPEYKDRIKAQTVESFTSEFKAWLEGKTQEFSRRKFEDMLFINSGLTVATGGDLNTIIPANFNYLENHAKARFQYAKSNGFLSDAPTLISHGTIVCDLDAKTEKASGIELFEWRYASMPKLAEFMKTNPDWKMQIGDRILDVSDPWIEDKDVLKFKTTQTQPAGLFSFFIFRDPQNNRIFLADSTILENNGIDTKQTLSHLGLVPNKLPKLYFTTGFDGCSKINSLPENNYEQFN